MLKGIGNIHQESKDCCVAQEMTVKELLERQRNVLIDNLEKVNSAITELERVQHTLPEETLKQVMKLGRIH